MGEPPGSPRPPPPLSRDVRPVTAFVRTFFIGGGIAYKGLFNWIRPSMYIPTMLIGPIFQILFFAKLGQYAGVDSPLNTENSAGCKVVHVTVGN